MFSRSHDCRFTQKDTGWDDAATSALRAHASGREPAILAIEGIDAYNAESVATREPLDYEHIVKEWELAREELKTAILTMPEEKLHTPMLFPWGGTGNTARIVAIFASHEEEHATEIRRRLHRSRD